MVALSFLCGVLCYELFSLEQATSIISKMDGRIVANLPYELKSTIVPLAISLAIVLLFSTHAYLYPFALVVIALRCTFFGFSSVYILTQLDAITLYSYWWFPFQLLYCILLVWLYRIVTVQQQQKKKSTQIYSIRFVFCIIFMVVILIFEIIVINYVLYK